MADDGGISRETVETDDYDVRLYQREDAELPSVTSILKSRNTDDSHLQNWQSRNDGTGDNAHHTHLFWYSRQIGTLGHWHALSQLQDIPWTADEAESYWALRNITTLDSDADVTAVDDAIGEFNVDGSNHREVHDATPRDVLYSVCANQHRVESWGEFYNRYGAYNGHAHYTDALSRVADGDIVFFQQQQQSLWQSLDISEDAVIAAEQYLFNEQHGYAGQVDLVYQDSNGDIVVADCKSSSGCYDKHKLQNAAYAKAIELSDDVPVDSVDRLEVHRVNPDTGCTAVHTSDTMACHPLHTTDYWSEGYDDLWSEFKHLADTFTYDVSDAE